MSNRIVTNDPEVPRIRLSDPLVPKISAEEVGNPGPLTLYALRVEMMRRRSSSGGRSGMDGVDYRSKIPLSELDWSQLEGIATSMSTEGFTPSAGQVASVLLKMAVKAVAGGSGKELSGSPLVAALGKEMIAQQAAG